MAAVALFMVGRLAKFNDIFTSTVPTINNFSNHALRINCLTLFVQLKIQNNILFLYTTNFAIESEKYWNRFFLEKGIEPFKVVYEDLVEKFEETALAILDFLGIEYPPDLQFAARYLLQQTDHINDEWEQKFLAAEAELSFRKDSN